MHKSSVPLFVAKNGMVPENALSGKKAKKLKAIIEVKLYFNVLMTRSSSPLNLGGLFLKVTKNNFPV